MTYTPTHRHPLVRANLSPEPEEWTLGSIGEARAVDTGNIKDWLNDVYEVLKEAVATPATPATPEPPDHRADGMFYSLPFKQRYFDEIQAMKSIESLATTRVNPVPSREVQDDALIGNVDNVALNGLLGKLGNSGD